MEKKDYNKIVEALLFLKGSEGLSISFLSEFLEVDNNYSKIILEDFLELYNSKSSSLVVKKFGNNYKMMIQEEIFTAIKGKLETKKLTKLSKVALETLSIIAYNQPVSKIEIDNIRGVNSDSIIYSLLEKELIYSNKVSDKIGKPKLYETTDYFLDIFGLSSLEDLPKLEQVNEEEKIEIDNFLND